MAVEAIEVRRRSELSRQVRRFLSALPFLAPSLILFSVFVFYPLVKSAYLGFFVSDPFGRRQIYVGFDQYRDVLTSSSFIKSLVVTGTFTLYTVVPALVLATLLAVLAQQRLSGISIFRTMFAAPVAASAAIATAMWLTILHFQIGVANYFIDLMDLPAVDWLKDGGWAIGDQGGFWSSLSAWFFEPNWLLISVSLVTLWMNVGFFTIIILAGLQNIPEELYESAEIDGAGRWAKFWHVTLPMLSPTLLFASVVGVIFALQAFGQVRIMLRAGGGPTDAANVIVYSIYRDGFENFARGAASVQAIALFVIMLVVTLVQLRLFERRVFYR
jgi:ABC-type sugar transport system permease subunit